MEVARVVRPHKLRGNAMLNGLLLQEPQIERPEHENDYDVHYQPLPEPVPEEQDVHADHDDYQREHVKHDGCQISPSSLSTTRCGVTTTLGKPYQEFPKSEITSQFLRGGLSANLATDLQASHERLATCCQPARKSRRPDFSACK